MKKKLLKTVLLASLFISVKTITAQCSLDQVGAPNFSTTCTLSDMAAAPNGTVYVVSYNSTQNKIFLHGATTSGSWAPVASISTSTTVKPIVAVNKGNDKVYVAIRDENAGKVGKLYLLTGSSLVQVGTAFSGTNMVSDLSVAFNSLGEEYVAYTDLSNSNKSTVKKWNGSAWVSVGAGTVSSAGGYFNSLVIDNADMPVVAFQDVLASNKATIMKFNGSAWISLGNLGTNTANSKLKVANNNFYYLAYTESTGSGVVQVYNGSSWSALGSPVTNLSVAANSFDFDLDPADVPVFMAILSTPPYPVAYKYSGVPTWSSYGATYLNSSTAISTNIGFDATGNPYFFYVDQPANNALNVKTLTVPVSISSQPLSVTRCNGMSGSFSIGTVGGTPGYQWQVSSTGNGFINANTSYTNATTPTLAFNAVPGINMDIVRCVVNAGCKNIISNSATLTVSTLSVSTTFTNPTCFNSNNGAISSTVTGGTSPYSYTWSPVGGNAANATSLYWNTYTLNTSDLNGCAATATVVLTSPPSINSSFSGNQNICNGSATTLTVNASGGVGPFTYSWTPSTNITPTTGSVVTANPSSSITYGVQITDATGCVATNTVGVNVNPLPTVSASASSTTICNGASTTLLAGGSADTYTWNPGGLTGPSVVVAPSSPIIYTVTGTSTLTGCAKTASLSITVNPVPTANAGPTKTLTCANPTVTLSGSTAGGVSYSWTGPGIVSGGTTLNPVVNAVGTYDLSVVSAAGCSSSMSTVFVTQDTTPPSPTASASGTITCSVPTVTLSGTPGAGVTYLWSGPGIVSGSTSQNSVVNAGGSYTLLVTSAINGCTNTAVANVTQDLAAPNPFASNSGTLTCAVTSVTLTGLPSSGVSYQWSGPGVTGSTTTQTTTANAGGTYTVMVTSAVNGCTNTAVTTVTQNTTVPVPTAGTTGTLTCSTANVTLNGGPGTGVTYLWSGPGITGGTTTQNTTANAAGNYTLKVTSAVNGCTNTAIAAVTQNTVAPFVTSSGSGTLTCAAPTATTYVSTLASPVSYAWTGTGILSGAATGTITTNSSGPKNYTITNISNGCYTTGNVVVSQNTIVPVATAGTSGSSITCTFANANLYGGPFSGVSYLWSGPGITGSTTSQNTTANLVGTYTLLVTDLVNGCTATATTGVTQNTTPPSIVTGPSQTITCATSSVALSSSSSADPSTTYLWTSAVAGSLDNYNISNPHALASGIFTVSVTNVNNGCVATATVEVYSDIAFPLTIVSFNPTNTITCINPTIDAIATTTMTTTAFSWLGSGIVAGASTSTATINQPGQYSVTVTNSVNGCSTTETLVVVMDVTIPPTGISASSTTICSGSSATLTASGAATYSWSSGPTGNTIIDSPAFTTVYTVTGTGTNGCVSMASETITVNAGPTLMISGPLNICLGSTAYLTASGASSYTWDTGANAGTISVTPTVSTTYTVTGSAGTCTASLATTVSIISSKNLSGTITSTTGATSGDVILYKYSAVLSRWDSVTTVPFTSSYSFSNIDSALYVVRAMPVAANIQVTYGDSAISWQDAKVINHGCTNNTIENIKLIPLANIGTGPGQLSGTITEGNGFGHRMANEFRPLVPGNPIGGIIVKGGKNPGGQMFVQTTTNASGQYTLSGLPLSSGANDYFIFVDIPGLDTNLTYHQTITSGLPQIANLDFYVDSMYINPTFVTGLKEENLVSENRIILFPNPASQQFSIEYELIKSTNVQIDLYDVIGHKVSNISQNGLQEKNKYVHKVTTEGLSPGIYFVKLKLNNTETVIKLILTK